jgi:GNAT superfamily N-acetyltransferase
MLAMTLVPFYAAPSIVFAQELFWWVEPEARSKRVGEGLLDAAQRWAEQKGATVLSMVALGKQELRSVSQFYERKGFDLLETTWTRKV